STSAEPEIEPATDEMTSEDQTSPNDDILNDGAETKIKFFGWTLPDFQGPFGTVILAFLSIIGGFILNLTPCVLPVIPIKIMTISQHADKPGQCLKLGIWMALGVVAFWLAIGLPVAFITSVTDPSRIFGIWWITLGIGLIIGVMGFGIMGLFMMQLPQSVYMINPKADTPFGSFMFGIMTAVLGLPCFGFIAGALLAGAATLPSLTVIIVFTSIGIGMAAPYLVLAAKPSLVDKIPRTGPASELVKQVMGLLLLASAAYFIGSGLIGLLTDKPYLGKQLHWWAVAGLTTASGLWLIMRTFQITSKPLPRITFTIIGLILSFITLWVATGFTSKAKETWTVQQAALQSDAGYSTKIWNNYTPAALAQAREDGKIVVLDFTAEWCLICKSLKATVLNPDPVKSVLAGDTIVSFTVDLTSNKAPGWDLLRDLGKTGIPMLAVFPQNGSDPWLSNAYTTDLVMQALENASQSVAAVNPDSMTASNAAPTN
ncbi:MAG: thioredoxin family protein, partial [Planctomycetota bacterium]|nr:thioredoxin family protein [Planctomycetota bacterium]